MASIACGQLDSGSDGVASPAVLLPALIVRHRLQDCAEDIGSAQSLRELSDETVTSR